MQPEKTGVSSIIISKNPKEYVSNCFPPDLSLPIAK